MMAYFPSNRKSLWTLAVLLIGLTTLTGCANTRMLNKAEDIHVYDDSNVVFLGYDIYIPDSRIKGINFICTDETPRKKTKQFDCFSINSSMGKTGYKGSAAYKMKFGKYRITNVTYGIKTGTEMTTQYYTDKHGKQQSFTTYNDKIKQCTMYTNFYKVFLVSKKSAPYIGHFIVNGAYAGNNCSPVKNSTVNSQFGKDVESLNNDTLKRSVRKHIDFLNY